MIQGSILSDLSGGAMEFLCRNCSEEVLIIINGDPENNDGSIPKKTCTICGLVCFPKPPTIEIDRTICPFDTNDQVKKEYNKKESILLVAPFIKNLVKLIPPKYHPYKPGIYETYRRVRLYAIYIFVNAYIKIRNTIK